MTQRIKHWRCDLPEAAEIRQAREAVGLTPAMAAEVAGFAETLPWIEAERGKRLLPRAYWSIFLLATDQHPTLRLAAR